MTDLKSALRNAIEIERAASRFYRSLAAKASDAETRGFLEKMAGDEDAHAAGFEQKSRDLALGKLPDWADFNVETVETAPEWRGVENISYEQALQVALEAEQHAELFYDALADTAPAKAVQDFFRQVADNEARHVATVAELIERAGKK